MTVLILVNDASGRVAEEGGEATANLLREAAGEEAEAVVGNVDALLSALDGSAAQTVVSAGGDGTIGAVASRLAGQADPPLFVPLPYGTANLIPRDLGLPLDPLAALEASFAAPDRRIDYADANGRALLHSCVFGTFAEVAGDRERLREAKGPAEAVSAAADAASALIAATPAHYRLVLDGEPLEAETNAVFVTNNAITGGERGVPVRDRLDAGYLVAYVSDSLGPLGFLKRVIEALSGGFDASDGVVRHVCREAVVRAAEGTLTYAADGEVREGEAEVRFRIRPGALRVPDLRR